MSKHRDQLWEKLASILGNYAQACVDYGASDGDEQCREYRKMDSLHRALCDHLETMQVELQ